ncbi:hypothetical protein GF342_01865 [Candidatus Woesearchaeota archaeon]|nr:hypothetical protein [Candidatus Woesearchaeota archaeon]
MRVASIATSTFKNIDSFRTLVKTITSVLIGLVAGFVILGILTIGGITLYYLLSEPTPTEYGGSPNIDPALQQQIEGNVVWIKYEYGGRSNYGDYTESSATGSGVITEKNGATVYIYTNRHVIDCAYTDSCLTKSYERVQVRTPDGKLHRVRKIHLSPHQLDAAILEITALDAAKYPAIARESDLNIGENVIAVGYPGYADRFVEFSFATGSVSAVRRLLAPDGYGFKSIESDAYTYFGSSGGGLFDTKGQLVGLNTWIDQRAFDQKSIALQFNSLPARQEFLTCTEGQYSDGETCLPYCEANEIPLDDGTCGKPCEDFYCSMTPMRADNSLRCIEENGERLCCDQGQILGEDGYCHLPCTTAGTYCMDFDAICYNNECIVCPHGYELYEDGFCY